MNVDEVAGQRMPLGLRHPIRVELGRELTTRDTSAGGGMKIPPREDRCLLLLGDPYCPAKGWVGQRKGWVSLVKGNTVLMESRRWIHKSYFEPAS